jgi:predicted membrane channel-forming protein YqfA (hemolysin III family)
MRLPAAFESEKKWYQINSKGARWFIYWSTVLAVISLAMLLIPGLNRNFGKNAVWFSFVYLIPAVQVWLYSKKL